MAEWEILLVHEYAPPVFNIYLLGTGLHNAALICVSFLCVNYYNQNCLINRFDNSGPNLRLQKKRPVSKELFISTVR